MKVKRIYRFYGSSAKEVTEKAGDFLSKCFEKGFEMTEVDTICAITFIDKNPLVPEFKFEGMTVIMVKG